MLIVTGYWKTDHNVTLGQLLYIGPANTAKLTRVYVSIEAAFILAELQGRQYTR